MVAGPEESGLGMLLAAAEQELPSSEVGVQKCVTQNCCRSLFLCNSCSVCHCSDAHKFYLRLCCNANFLQLHGVVVQPHGKNRNNSRLQVYSCSHHFPLSVCNFCRMPVCRLRLKAVSLSWM